MKLDVSTREGYDIAVALGGSGIHKLPTLKRLITGSIRRVCKVDSDHCVLYQGSPQDQINLQREILWLRYELPGNTPLCEVALHWMGHAIWAMNALPQFRGTWIREFTRALEAATFSPYQDSSWALVEVLLRRKCWNET